MNDQTTSGRISIQPLPHRRAKRLELIRQVFVNYFEWQRNYLQYRPTRYYSEQLLEHTLMNRFVASSTSTDEQAFRDNSSLPLLFHTFRREQIRETTREQERRAEVTHCIFFELLRRLNVSVDSRERVAGNCLFLAASTTLESLLDPTTLPSPHRHSSVECRRYWLSRMKLLAARLFQMHEVAIQYSVANCVNMEKLKWIRVEEKIANTLYIMRPDSYHGRRRRRQRIIKIEKPPQKEWASIA